MTTQEISRVEYLNEIFPLNVEENRMPVCVYIDDLRDSIIKLSELMVDTDTENWEHISSILVTLSGTLRLLSDMKQSVLQYSAGCGA